MEFRSLGRTGIRVSEIGFGTAALLTWFGVIHAWEITPGGLVSPFGWAKAPAVAGGYLVMAALFSLFALGDTGDIIAGDVADGDVPGRADTPWDTSAGEDIDEGASAGDASSGNAGARGDGE